MGGIEDLKGLQFDTLLDGLDSLGKTPLALWKPLFSFSVLSWLFRELFVLFQRIFICRLHSSGFWFLQIFSKRVYQFRIPQAHWCLLRKKGHSLAHLCSSCRARRLDWLVGPWLPYSTLNSGCLVRRYYCTFFYLKNNTYLDIYQYYIMIK